jgi:hypothetical protein
MAFRKGLQFTWMPINNISQDSVIYLDNASGSEPLPPPVGSYMITENNIFMIDELTLGRMITE